jgi:hypothetical protein
MNTYTALYILNLPSISSLPLWTFERGEGGHYVR